MCYSYLQKERSATKFERDSEEFYNPKITKVEVTVEVSPNELNAQNMEYHHYYDEIMKHFRACYKFGVAGSEDFACATLPTTPLIFKAKF